MPVEIIPGLWLGNESDSQSYFLIKEKNIHVIINCTANLPFLMGEEHLEKKRFSILDSPQENHKMYQNLEYMTHFINRSLNKNHNILIHSEKGYQRAPTLIAAYFIRYGKVNANMAIKYIQNKLPSAFRPQATFDFALGQFATDKNKERQL